MVGADEVPTIFYTARPCEVRGNLKAKCLDNYSCKIASYLAMRFINECTKSPMETKFL